MDGLENNTKRYIKIMSEAADAALPQPSRLDLEEDTFDILYKQVSHPSEDLCLTSQALSDILHAADMSSESCVQRLEKMQELQAQGIEVSVTLWPHSMLCIERSLLPASEGEQ